jgi:uncharacterized surface protein with fasciclin (FAS1) repeats
VQLNNARRRFWVARDFEEAIMKIKLLLSVGFIGLGLVSCMPKASAPAAAAPAAAPAMAAPMLDIVDTAAGNKDFSTLVAAVQAAGLVETLKSKGPFTVFAPTNAAFAKLPAGTVESLLKPENKATLVKILTYHVVSGKVLAADVVKLDGKMVKTVQGSDVSIAVAGGKVKVNDSNVIATDIETSNGVIHVIDTVLLPK